MTDKTKKIIAKATLTILFLSMFAPIVVSAQSQEEGKVKEPATKLEAFLAKKGKLIVKNFYKIGELAGSYSKIDFKALMIYEPGQESQKIRGLTIEITEGGSYEKSNTSFLDLEEIESLSKGLEYMINLSEKWKETNKGYTEIIFSTKGDFSIGFYQDGAKQSAFSSSGYIGKVHFFFSSMKDMSSVKSIVDKGLKLLSEK